MLAYSTASSQETAAYNKALLSHIHSASYGGSPTHYPEMLNGVAWMTPFDFEVGASYRLRGEGGVAVRQAVEAPNPVTALDLSPLELCARACPYNKRWEECGAGAKVDRRVGDARCTKEAEYFALPPSLEFKSR